MGQVYLLLGPEKGDKEDFIIKVKSQVSPCDVSKFYAFDDYEEELFAQLNNNDLFADHKLVILDEAQEIKTKDKVKPLVEYLKSPSDCATLIISSAELYINSDIMAAVPAQNVMKFYEMFESKKNEWLQGYFRRNGLGIDASACNAIIEKVENNKQDFENTCSQMIIHLKTIPDKKFVTYEDVEDFLTHTREENEFTLFSYIAKGKLDSALECLHTLLRTKDAATVTAMVASRLSTYFRRALSIQMNAEKGMGTSLRKGDDGSAFTTKYFDGDRPITMPKDKEVYRDACSRYNRTDIERILMLLAEYDIKIKEIGTVMQQTMMERCIVDVVCHKGRHIRQPEFAKL